MEATVIPDQLCVWTGICKLNGQMDLLRADTDIK